MTCLQPLRSACKGGARPELSTVLLGAGGGREPRRLGRPHDTRPPCPTRPTPASAGNAEARSRSSPASPTSFRSRASSSTWASLRRHRKSHRRSGSSSACQSTMRDPSSRPAANGTLHRHLRTRRSPPERAVSPVTRDSTRLRARLTPVGSRLAPVVAVRRWRSLAPVVMLRASAVCSTSCTGTRRPWTRSGSTPASPRCAFTVRMVRPDCSASSLRRWSPDGRRWDLPPRRARLPS